MIIDGTPNLSAVAEANVKPMKASDSGNPVGHVELERGFQDILAASLSQNREEAPESKLVSDSCPEPSDRNSAHVSPSGFPDNGHKAVLPIAANVNDRTARAKRAPSAESINTQRPQSTADSGGQIVVATMPTPTKNGLDGGSWTVETAVDVEGSATPDDVTVQSDLEPPRGRATGSTVDVTAAQKLRGIVFVGPDPVRNAFSPSSTPVFTDAVSSAAHSRWASLTDRSDLLPQAAGSGVADKQSGQDILKDDQPIVRANPVTYEAHAERSGPVDTDRGTGSHASAVLLPETRVENSSTASRLDSTLWRLTPSFMSLSSRDTGTGLSSMSAGGTMSKPSVENAITAQSSASAGIATQSVTAVAADALSSLQNSTQGQPNASPHFSYRPSASKKSEPPTIKSTVRIGGTDDGATSAADDVAEDLQPIEVPSANELTVALDTSQSTGNLTLGDSENGAEPIRLDTVQSRAKNNTVDNRRTSSADSANTQSSNGAEIDASADSNAKNDKANLNNPANVLSYDGNGSTAEPATTGGHSIREPNTGGAADASERAETPQVALQPSAHSMTQIANVTLKVTVPSEHYGPVELRAKMNGEEVTASLTVEHRDGHALLSADLPALHKMLSERHLQVGEIVLRHEPASSGGTADQQSNARRGQAPPRQAGTISKGDGRQTPIQAGVQSDPVENAIIDSQGRLNVQA